MKFQRKRSYDERLLYLNFIVSLEKTEENPPISNLSAKRLGEGGTQAFDIKKYSIYFITCQGINSELLIANKNVMADSRIKLSGYEKEDNTDNEGS